MFVEVAAAACALSEAPAANEIYESRVEFNRALRDEDIQAIRSVLSNDVVLVTATDSLLFVGRDAQLEVWAKNFGDDARLVYQRETRCITLSPIYPIAMEAGVWRGAMQAGDEDYVGGAYTAKWRLIDEKWRIEAETYMTTNCGGALCPESAGRTD